MYGRPETWDDSCREQVEQAEKSKGGGEDGIVDASGGAAGGLLCRQRGGEPKT